ncbi:MAG TPA: LuxR C-terminal-related transcriptional regulator [Ktedonobacterales bacterium]|nr:LuxR C-terminal-related transcriptional regulator [Ktedonobacterales bacterium]
MSAMRHPMTLMITTESLAFGAFVVDGTHRIVSWNESASCALGYDADRTLGRTCEEMLVLLRTQDVPVCPEVTDPLDSVEAAEARCPSQTSTPHPHALPRHDTPIRVRVITQGGATRWLEVSALHARKLDGSACVVHIFHDVTDHAEAHRHSAVAADTFHHPGGILRLPVGHAESIDRDSAPTLTLEHLTPREHEVLELLARGMATIEIATELGISRVTARNHVTRVIEKLGVKSRLQAVLVASRLGLV